MQDQGAKLQLIAERVMEAQTDPVNEALKIFASSFRFVRYLRKLQNAYAHTIHSCFSVRFQKDENAM